MVVFFCALTWVNHLRAMLDGNLDDLISSEISTDRGVLTALANDVCLVGLCGTMVREERRGQAAA